MSRPSGVWLTLAGYQSLPQGVKVLDQFGSNAAEVQGPNGQEGFAESMLPLDGQTPGGGSAPLDLGLKSQAGGFVPQSALTPVSIPGSSNGELAFSGALGLV